VSQFPSVSYGSLSYLVLACVSAVVGYYFARKRTEYEVGYRHRVEVFEGVQGMVIPLVEEFEAALEYVRAPGPSGELPVEEIERSIDGLKKYLAQHEMWLDRRSSAALGNLISTFRARLRVLDLLPPPLRRSRFREGLRTDCRRPRGVAGDRPPRRPRGTGRRVPGQAGCRKLAAKAFTVISENKKPKARPQAEAC
jgi:hypothetical protein